MVFLIIISLFSALLVVFWFLTKNLSKYNCFGHQNLPPGPRGWPLIGCLPYLNSITAHRTFEDWSRKYGPIMSFYMGDMLVVVLSSGEVIREAFVRQGDIFNGRNVIRAFRAKNMVAGLGLTGAESDLWTEQRRFCLNTLKDFGAGRSILEPKIIEESRFLLQEFSKHDNKPFDAKPLLHYAVSNIIMQLVFGNRFEYHNQEYKDCLDTLSFRLSKSGINALSGFNFFPQLLRLPQLIYANKKNVHKVENDGVRTLQFLRRLINEKTEKVTASSDHDHADNYVDAFLKASSENRGRFFNQDQLLIAVQQLFIAGGETTATTLRWSLWYMCKFQHYQQRVFEEILHCIGSDCAPSWSDHHHRTHFTEAVLYEIERIRTVFPFSVTHRTVQPTNLEGYFIPSDSYVIPLIWAVHRDPTYFPEPDEFRPERFLDNENRLIKIVGFMPFGVGKRACLGESLAKMELYMFFAAMIQRFHFRFADNVDIDKLKEPDVVGAVISPESFQIIAEFRTAK